MEKGSPIGIASFTTQETPLRSDASRKPSAASSRLSLHNSFFQWNIHAFKHLRTALGQNRQVMSPAAEDALSVIFQNHDAFPSPSLQNNAILLSPDFFHSVLIRFW
ncbi:MAG: hypothetical protein RDU30_17530 [Desulfovibrionaceae bacterium]|nr:hypothetical protein [Desulfovibrionaceae bacterium]